MFAIHFN